MKLSLALAMLWLCMCEWRRVTLPLERLAISHSKPMSWWKPMHNRYKRDLNRLVEHPRRLPQSRKLRAPGGLNGVFVSVAGLSREPFVPEILYSIMCIPSLVQSSDTPMGYGKPFEDGGGAPINPPLGTFGGSDRAWTFGPTISGWETTKGLNHQLYGERNWVGTSLDDVLSWNGPESRVCALYRWPTSQAISAAGAAVVFWKGTVLYALSFTQIYNLEGAAIAYKNGDRYLRVCTSNAQRMHRNRDSAQLSLTIYEMAWPEGGSPGSPGQVGTFSASHTHPPCSGAYFSQDGNSMVLTCAKGELGECYVYRWNDGGGI